MDGWPVDLGVRLPSQPSVRTPHPHDVTPPKQSGERGPCGTLRRKVPDWLTPSGKITSWGRAKRAAPIVLHLAGKRGGPDGQREANLDRKIKAATLHSFRFQFETSQDFPLKRTARMPRQHLIDEGARQMGQTQSG